MAVRGVRWCCALVFIVALCAEPSAHADPLQPSCGSQSASGWSCELQSQDSAGLRFQAAWQPEGGGRLAVDVVDGSGAVVQTITKSGPAMWLRTRDLDRDGRDELLIQSSCGTGGCGYDIWRATGRSVQFRDMGEVFGKSIGHAPGGLLVTDEAGSAATRFLTFFRLGDTKTESLVVLRLDAPKPSEEAPWACALMRDRSNLTPLGMDSATAERTFCKEAKEVDWR